MSDPRVAGAAAQAAPAPDAATTANCRAVIVHYRCAPDLLRCLDSLGAHAPDLGVVVVDNGSDDESLAELARGLEGLTGVDFVQAAGNLGFGAGCNLGIERALEVDPDLRYVLLLNPDTIAEPRFLEELLVTAAQHPDAGVVGGRILSLGADRILFENGRVPRWTLSGSHVPAPAGRTEYETEFVTGALMLVAADMLRAGLRFDESYFLYAEDMDFCCEVRARGRTLWINTAAEIRHREGGSQLGEAPILGAMRPLQLYSMTRSKTYFARKRLGRFQRLVFLLVAVVLKPLVGVLTSRSLRFLPWYFAGLRDGLRLPCARA